MSDYVSHDEAKLLVEILLAREPSQQAVDMLTKKNHFDAAIGIILGNEFIDTAESVFIRESSWPNELRKRTISHHHVKFLNEKLLSNPKAKRLISLEPSWSKIYSSLIRDECIQSEISKQCRYHRNFARFQRLLETRSISTYGTLEESPEIKLLDNKHYEQMHHRSGLLSSNKTLALSKSPQLNYHLNNLRSLKSRPKIVSAIKKLFIDKDRLKLSFLYEECLNSANVDDYISFFVKYYQARLLLSQNAASSAFAIMKDIIEQRHLMFSNDIEKHQFMQVFTQSLIRTGQVNEACQVQFETLRNDPHNAEALYQIGLLNRIRNEKLSVVYFQKYLSEPIEIKPERKLLIADFFASIGETIRSLDILNNLRSLNSVNRDIDLGFMNVEESLNQYAGWQGHMKNYFRTFGLQEPTFYSDKINFYSIGSEQSEQSTSTDAGPLVSVIMTSYNSETTIYNSCQSVLGQSHKNIELIIVDDLSSDNTRNIINEISEQDKRVTVIHNTVNSGTYVSKNSGILIAKGDYITFHDSDDWMHPQRLERHLQHMHDSNCVANMSKWIRMSVDGRAEIRFGGGYTHDNPASTFIAKHVFERIGYFDSVRTGADSEFLWRMISVYGSKLVSSINLCLAVGLHHSLSLTQSGATAFDEFRFSRVRLDYWEQWVKWQLTELTSKGNVYVPYPQSKRNFPAPIEIIPTLL